MKGLNSNNVRSGRLALSLFLITSLLLILHYYCYLRSYAMEIESKEVVIIEEEMAIKSAEIISDIVEDAQDSIEEIEEEIEEVEKTVYEIPSSYVNPVSGHTMSYKGGKTIERSSKITYKSSCCSEFIIDESTIRSDIYERGNASLKHSTWDSPVVSVVVYDQYYDM